MHPQLVIQGTAFHSLKPGEIEILKDYLFIVNDQGELARCVSPTEVDYHQLVDKYKKDRKSVV